MIFYQYQRKKKKTLENVTITIFEPFKMTIVFWQKQGIFIVFFECSLTRQCHCNSNSFTNFVKNAYCCSTFFFIFNVSGGTYENNLWSCVFPLPHRNATLCYCRFKICMFALFWYLLVAFWILDVFKAANQWRMENVLRQMFFKAFLL